MIRQHIDFAVERSLSGRLLSLSVKKNSKVPVEHFVSIATFKLVSPCLKAVQFILFEFRFVAPILLIRRFSSVHYFSRQEVRTNFHSMQQVWKKACIR